MTFFTKCDLLEPVGTVLVVVGMVPKRNQIRCEGASMEFPRILFFEDAIKDSLTLLSFDVSANKFGNT